MPFNIRDHIEFDSKGRAICPACDHDGKGTKKNLSLVPETDGAFKCFRGHTSQEIREALGNPKPEQIPQPAAKAESTTVSPMKVKQANDALSQAKGETANQAKLWLLGRGINMAMVKSYGLGLGRCKVGEAMRACISIPIPNPDKTAYWQKKRVEPWNPEVVALPEYSAWKQYGIPQQVYFTNKPDSATETWLCEGEWDAIFLGWTIRQSKLKESIAICTFTCGSSAVPPQEQLDRMPGKVTIFYDRDAAGEQGAIKAAEKLGERAKIATVPMPDGGHPGWDISDALQHGFTLPDLQKAAKSAVPPPTDKPRPENPLRDRMLWNDDLIDSAPDYTEWLVPDLLTANELFLLAAGPRTGKSLLAMTLAHAIASGGSFLGRPTIQGPVMYVCLEDGKGKIKEREQAQGWTRGLPVAWFPKFKLGELPHLHQLAEEIDPRLIVIDTLSRAKDSDISESSAEMSQVLEPLQEMAQSLDCCVLLVHHTSKVKIDNATQIDLFDTIRGSSAIRAVCRGSMVIAAGERDYRLVVENGWGKHDLRVVLDANSLNWKLLGKWNPTVENTSQKAAILDFLKQTQVATLEQIHDATGIPKKSLYEQLSRMQTAEEAAEKVVKQGHRRSYTYQLALFNTIQQLNSVLNSENADTASVTGYIQQKTTFLPEGDQAKADQVTRENNLLDADQQKSNFLSRPDQACHLNPLIDSETGVLNSVLNRTNADTASDSVLLSPLDQLLPPTNTESVEYAAETHTPQTSQPIQHLFNNGVGVEYPDQVTREKESAINHPPTFKNGERVEVSIDGAEWKPALFERNAQGSVMGSDGRLHAAYWVSVGSRPSRRLKVAEIDIRGTT